MAVAVGVDDLERALVDLQPLDRAAERNPELLVEFPERPQVVPGLKRYLIQPPLRKNFHRCGVGAVALMARTIGKGVRLGNTPAGRA